MIAGITVLPVRSTRAAPSGRGTSPFIPIRVNVPSSTTNAEFAIGALPSPTISCAPSNKTTLLRAAGVGWLGGGDEHAAARKIVPHTTYNAEPAEIAETSRVMPSI